MLTSMRAELEALMIRDSSQGIIKLLVRLAPKRRNKREMGCNE